MSNPYDQFDSLPATATEPNPYDQFDAFPTRPPGLPLRTDSFGGILIDDPSPRPPVTDSFGGVLVEDWPGTSAPYRHALRAPVINAPAPGTKPASGRFTPEQYEVFARLSGLGPAISADMSLRSPGLSIPAETRPFDPEKPEPPHLSVGPYIDDASTSRSRSPEELELPSTLPSPTPGSAPRLTEPQHAPSLPAREIQPPGELRFWDKMKKRWDLGREQAADDQLAYRAMMGEIPWESVRDRIEPSQSRDDTKGKAWYSEGLLSAVEMIPAMAESATEGAEQGLVTGGGFAGITALAGQAGPQIAAPEELITVPVSAGMGYMVGQALGSSNYWYRQGAGSLYHDLRKEGIPHKAAQTISGAFGFPYAAIESLQVGKFIPGLKTTAAQSIAAPLKRRLLRLAKEKGADYVDNIGQELGQEILKIGAEALAETISHIEPPKDKASLGARLLSTAQQTAAAIPFLMAPKAVADARRTIRERNVTTQPSVNPPSTPKPRAANLEERVHHTVSQGDRAARFLLELEKRKLLRRLDETNPETASGKILNERLLEIEALIIKFETKNAQQKPANSSTSALRFSRRESGESENGIHRLAKPQKSRYESPQDERNDPAAALHSLLRGDDPTASQQRGKPGRRLASHAELLAWSGEHGKILDPSRFPNVQAAVGGGEHIVFPALDQPGRLYKLTKPGYFGAQAEDAGKYLQRWALANQVLDDEVHFEGIVTLPGETEARAVISQPEIKGRDATGSEQADYLHSKGFVEEDGRWIHPVLGVSIWDTITPGNVIVRPDGSMQAVDLQIGPAKADDLNSVRERTGIGRPTVFSKEAIRPGDELLRRANELVTITEGISHYPTLRHAEALDWLRNPINGVVGEHKNRDTGLSWNVSVTSLSKMVKQGIKAGEPAGAHAARIAASYHLPELIENAIGFQVEDLRNDQNVSRLYDLFTPFRFNGTLYRIRIKGKASDHQANKAHSMRVDDIVAEKVPLEGIGNLASESPRITTATNGEITLRQLFKGVNPYSGSVFSLGKNLPSAKLTPEQNAEHSRRVQSWVEQVTAPWANRLPIVVHNSASAIPDTALRELVTSEENVDGFYNPADGSIHLLADKVTSREDAERIIRHEGMHLVFDGPLREEYLNLLDRVAKSIPEDRLREISERYKNQGPEVWLEEYLAQEGQNSPNSPVWRQFVYEIKRLLRRAFGDSIEFSDADIVAFLSKARRTMENGSKGSTGRKLSPKEESFSRIQQERGRILGKISATDPRSAAAEILKDRLGELDEQLYKIQPAPTPPWGDFSDLRFTKTPKRSSWSEVRNGDLWNSVKKFLPKEQVEAPKFDI